MFVIALIVVLLSGALAFGVAVLVRRRATKLGLVQAPNERSSHTVPTPTGGGIGIVAGGTLAGLPMATLDPWLVIPVLVAGLLMAVIGYADDRRSLPVSWRLGGQVLLMGAVIALIPTPALQAGLGLPLPEIVLFVLLALAGALWINLFNFMDGIDGLAATEAIFILCAAVLLSISGFLQLQGHYLALPLSLWMLGLAAATFGFLLLNWPPAKLFMGDTGSTYLGLLIAFFAIATLASGWLTLSQWLILPATFLADSLTTLGRRLLRREPIWQAHKRHAYQALQRRFSSHRNVTLLYVAINLVVLLPGAALAGLYPQWGWALVLTVYLLLVPLALLAGAGAPLQPEADK
jgi:Fuc2NAc and GlcNAc transferase